MRSILKIFVVLVLAAGVPLTSCSGGDDDSSVVTTDENFDAALDYSTVSSEPSSVQLSISTARDWTVTLDTDSQAWLTLSSSRGSQTSVVKIQIAQNTGTEDRTADIKVSNGLKTITLQLVQRAENTSVNAEGWLELPEISALANTQVIYHYMPDNPSMRNYTMLYDTSEKMAYWVAYPMHASFMGGSGRSNAWNYDPQVSQDGQPTLFWGINGYQRGHQIPSADRTNSLSTNETTFYFTNMTPQIGNLNEGLWADLETKVRTWTKQCDTLYVVTGAMLTASKDDVINYTYDNNQKPIAVPKYYFKALLKRKNNNYSSIAFRFNNADTVFPNISQYQMTVSDLENLTGFKFFPKINTAVKEKIVDSDWK
ncbi:DNA/RNA non-specific endonuclease [Daejeonia sp. YH14]|uniref:DNA/RNA non-specific endonuclease n=1 Tax=Daejeonia sp. YH14 TaxID=3439042 RepID=UPI003F498404